ncbi:MAG: hypothetical protein ABGX25_01935, partial [Nautiliaceae bacterium]
HGNANWNVNGIDVRISHFPQNSKYTYFIFEEPRLKELYLGPNPKEEKKIANQIRKKLEKKYGKDIVVLGTIGRFIKLQSEEYIKLICEVMKKYKNTIYLACGDGCIHVKDLVLKYGGEEVLSRWIFPGQVNPHIYGWVIDIWPDTFPLRQGKSLGEFLAKGKCFVRIHKEFVQKQGKNLVLNNELKYILKHLSNEEKHLFLRNPQLLAPIFDNQKDYKEFLELFITNKNIRSLGSKLQKLRFRCLFSKQYNKDSVESFMKLIQ